MFAALFAAALLGTLVVAAFNPIWVGSIFSGAVAFIPIPVELTVVAIYFSKLQIIGIRIAYRSLAHFNIGKIAFQLWPLRICISDVRGRVDLSQSTRGLRQRANAPSILAPFMPYLTAIAVKLLSLLVAEVNRIALQVNPVIAIHGREHPQSLSIETILLDRGKSLHIEGVHLLAFNSMCDVSKLHAHFDFLLNSERNLSVSVHDIRLHTFAGFVVMVAATELIVTKNSAEAFVRVVNALAESKPFWFVGGFFIELSLRQRSAAAALFGCRLHLDPIVDIISNLRPLLDVVPLPRTLSKPELDFTLYGSDLEVTALEKKLVIAYIMEVDVVCQSIVVISCRNVRSRMSGAISNDIVRISSISLSLCATQVCLQTEAVNIRPQFDIAPMLLPLAQLASSFSNLIPENNPPVPAHSVNIEVTLNSIQVALPRMFDVNMQSSIISVNSKQFILNMVEPECFYESKQFLSLSFVKVSGRKPESSLPHPSIDISADVARGHWTPSMQYDILYLIKQIVALVIRCKRDLFPLVFPPCDQVLPPQPSQIAKGLPYGERPFYEWAFRDRAPYLVEKLQIISLCVSDILLSASVESSMTLTIYAERFSSDFIPWHWHLSRFAVCIESFPLFHALSLDISRDCDTRDISIFDLKQDTLLTEQTSKLLMYAPIRVSASSISFRCPSYESSIYDSVMPLSILSHLRGLIEAMSTIPTLDELARQNDGPGYMYPPDFCLRPIVNFRCLHVSLCLVDTCWNSWIHHIHPISVDERMGSESRRELLRLKIREHQRLTGQLLSDSKISLMSSRLLESNFELYRNRIIRLKAIHSEKWSFPSLDCISSDSQPGDFRLGSLLSVTILELECKMQSVSVSTDTIFCGDISFQSESFEISLRQFCPSVVDISRIHLAFRLSVQQDSFCQSQACNLDVSPRHRVQFNLPLQPPLLSVRVHTIHIQHPCLTLSPILIHTVKDILFLCRKLRPVFIDPAIRSLSTLDLARYVLDIRLVDNFLVDNFSIRLSHQMAFCTSTDSSSFPSIVIKGTHLKAFFNSSSNSIGLSVDEFTVALDDERYDSQTKVHMSHESAYKPDPAHPENIHELYETGALLHCFRIESSVKVSFISASGIPSTARLSLKRNDMENDPFTSFRTSQVAVVLKLCAGSHSHKTKMMLNTHNLPSLFLLSRSVPSFDLPDLSNLQLSISQISVLNCSFTLLDVANDSEPGQGLRFHLSEIQSKFDFDSCAIHNFSIKISGLNSSLVANDAFWRKCDTGHELAHDIRNGTVVVVHTYENQRFILGQGWLNRLLPTDRPNWSDIGGTQELPRDSPLFDLPSEYWEWKSDWVIDRGQLCGKGKVDSDGWEYAHDFPRAYTAKRHWTDNVRRRRWFRVRRLIDSVDENIQTDMQERHNRKQNGLLFLVDACDIVQKPCSTLIFKPGSPLQSPSRSISCDRSTDALQITRISSLLTFFSIGTHLSPTSVSHEQVEIAGNSPPESPSATADVPFSSPYLLSVHIANPKARLTLESRNALVQLFRAYFNHFEYYFRLRSAPLADIDHSVDNKQNCEDNIFAQGVISDEDETELNDDAVTDFSQVEDDDVQAISHETSIISNVNPDPDSINPVDLLDIVSIEISNGQIALDSPVESACGIVLACMQSCLVTARSFDGGGSKQESERIDVRLLIDNLTIRLAPTDIDVDAKPMWFDFEESSQSVMKAVFSPFPVQATAMLYPFSSSHNNVFLLLPTITATLDHLQCALLESILLRVLFADLPLPPLQSATEFVRFEFAAISAFDGRITNHQRILWQIRHLEWLMGVYSASDPVDVGSEESESGELALLSAHLCSLRQQFVDSIMSVSVDLHTSLSAYFSANPLDVHFRLDAFVISLVSVNKVEFLRTTISACSGLLQVEFKGEGSLQLCFDIRDVRVVDVQTDMDDWKNVLIPAYLCGSNGLATTESEQNVENRAVLTLQCNIKRVGGIVVICSCVLNATHLVARITQGLVDDLSDFVSSESSSKADHKLLQTRLVPKASCILAQVDRPEPTSPAPEQTQGQGSLFDESTPAHLRDLRLYSERSQNSIIITYLRIGPVRATISFKGYSSSGIADFQGVSVRMPAMVYQKKTWTLRQFSRRLRRDLIKAALKQAAPGLASFLKYKFGGASTDMGSFSYASHEDLNALDIDVPVGSIPIQPSPHPIARAKTAVGDVINKFKSGQSEAEESVNVSVHDQAAEVKDPDKRYLLFGKQSKS